MWLTWCHTILFGKQFFFQKMAKMRPKSKIGDHHAIFTDLRDLDKKHRGGAWKFDRIVGKSVFIAALSGRFLRNFWALEKGILPEWKYWWKCLGWPRWIAYYNAWWLISGTWWCHLTVSNACGWGMVNGLRTASKATMAHRFFCAGGRACPEHLARI